MQTCSRFIFRITHYISPPLFPKSTTTFQIHTLSPPPKNPLIHDYLVHTLNFPEPKASTISNLHPNLKTLQKPLSVVKYFKSLGFNDAQIVSLATVLPKVLFADVDKTIRPKIAFFQEVGFSAPVLAKFICKNASLLACSLTKKLKPTVGVVRNILSEGGIEDVNHGLIRILSKRTRFLHVDHHVFLANVLHLESCGVKGFQLARLLIYNPGILVSETNLKRQISRAVDLGFSFGSRMFMNGLNAISNISNETFEKKVKLFKSFGFTDVELMNMFRRAPNVLKVSEDKLRFGVGFYLETVGLEKSALVKSPACLTLDMKNRVVPRHRVLNLVKSKGILKNKALFTTVLGLNEEKFFERYITRFPDHAEELLYAYKGHLVDPKNKGKESL